MTAIAYPSYTYSKSPQPMPTFSQKVYLVSPPATTSDINARIKEDFERLADAWRKEVQFSSSIFEIVMNKNYQSIIGRGVSVLPFILNDLKKGPDHWYWALAAITGAKPAEHASPGDIAAISTAWLDWGKRSGIIQ